MCTILLRVCYILFGFNTSKNVIYNNFIMYSNLDATIENSSVLRLILK